MFVKLAPPIFSIVFTEKNEENECFKESIQDFLFSRLNNKDHPMFVDTHCHLNLMAKQNAATHLEQALAEQAPLTDMQLEYVQHIVQDAQQTDTSTILTVGTTLQESKNCIHIAQTYPGVFAIVGIHPNDCTPDWKKDFQEIKKLAHEKEHSKIVGIGETGLDFYWPNPAKERQRNAFKAHIELALASDLALVIHLRQAQNEQAVGFAQQELFEMLHPYKHQITRGIMHCFSHDKQFADMALAWGFALGIGGIITYPKNERLREIIREIPLEKLVLETDAPFLPPQIARGKQNHPKYIATIARFLAQLKQVSIQEVAAKTTATAQRIFQF
jgi:TatD DNase family protein